ncbi:MAG: ABC transporter transmembrane domain-containing protein, partial [Cyclobacteriaceae bacterium]
MAKRRGPLDPEDKRKLNRSNLSKLLEITRYIKPYKTYFILGMICLAFSSTTLLAFPFLAGKLVDIADGKNWTLPFPASDPIVISHIRDIGIALIIVLFIQSVFSFFRVYFLAQVNERAMADMRRDMYARLVRLPMYFFDRNRVGELISRITSDVTLLQDTFSVTLAEFIRQIATLLIGSLIIFLMSTRLTLFMLATFPVLVIAALIFGNFIRRLSRQTQDKLANANVIVEETLQSVQIVKAFTNEPFEINRYKQALNELIRVALRTAKYRGAF